MRYVFVALAVAAMAMPAFAAVDYFPVTADGSFNNFRSGEGYTNAGLQGIPRMMKSNQHSGWMSFANTVGDNSGLSLAAFLAANPGATAKLYFRTNGALPAPGTDPNRPVGAFIESIRSGNTGQLVEDGGTSGSYTPAAPAPGFEGSSQLVAFRGGPVPAGGFSATGDGIYVNRDPAQGGGIPWIAPSGRALTGRNNFLFQGGDMIRYDISNNGLTPTGLYDGYQQDGTQGANFWALEDLLGLRENNGGSNTTPARIYEAGQILVGGQATPTIVNSTAYVGTLDPRNKNNDSTDDFWHAVVIDAAFLADIASGAEHKGLYFGNQATFVGANFSNVGFYSQDQSGGIYEAYLEVVPEPATMVLLALGGLALLRRRNA